MSEYLLPDKVYDVLKWVGLSLFPALAVFAPTVGTAVGWGETEIAVTVLNAIGVLIGALIGASALKKKVGDNGED